MTKDAQDDIESRLARLEDRLEIHQLFVDYGRHLDRGDFAAFAELFARDGEILLGPMGRAKGRREIQTFMEATLAGGVGETVHIISSPAIELDGDVATSEVMWTVLARTPEGTLAVTMAGRHVDDLVREEGSWRIRRRKGLVDLPNAGRMR
jgi:uncharacterized protein (TIGR02246 family)